MTRGCSILWSFFGIGHRKGPHDSSGIVVKLFICKEQLKGPIATQLQCTADVVNFLKANLSQRNETSCGGSKKLMKHFFWRILEHNDCPTTEE